MPLATSYDEVPYPRLAFPLTHPSHLATVGRLLGMAAANVDNCRVLELGCASGANLVPMAYGLPNSRFVGIDLSERQISDGREFIAALGLKNVSLESLDICEAAERLIDGGQFDFIIAHGIYSWVPDPVKDALLAACRGLLAPGGIAYVSYNCYPGCKTRDMLRQICQYHGRGAKGPREYAATTRRFLEFLDKALEAIRKPPAERGTVPFCSATIEAMVPAAKGDSPRRFSDGAYRAVLRQQVQDLVQVPDELLLHDDLERDNDPRFFHQFMSHAAGHRLAYLGDAYFGQMFGAGIKPEALERIRRAGDRLDFEQYLDFLYGRSLRTTLLSREEDAVSGQIVPDDLRHLWISSDAKPVSTEGSALVLSEIRLEDRSPIEFRTAECTLSVAMTLGKATLFELASAAPRALSFSALVDRVERRMHSLKLPAEPPSDSPQATRRLMDTLVEWFAMRLIELQAYCPPLAAEIPERPTASAVARYQAAHGWSRVTNLFHRRIQLDGELAGHVLAMLDGRHDRAAIVEALVKPVAEGKVEARFAGRPVVEPNQLRPILAERIDACLRDFARHALLVETT